ncbi:MAG: aryl-sulfate sulfotransferase [Dehalococcoidales bacterium]|nr:aryl-sulfate sulfotransferase [Dehalococcoidales bacterium]
MAYTLYPTGTTVYDPEKAWNGYTVFQAHMFENKSSFAVLIDMNGNVVNQWKGLDGIPNKMLPGGYVMGNTGSRDSKYGSQDQLDLVQVDWEGNIVWQFNKYQRIRDGRKKPQWMARQHHDFQREGNPVGYYVPGMDPLTDRGNTIILSHKNLVNTKISEKPLLDDAIIEVTWEGEIVWEWLCSDHFEEMNFTEDAKNTLSRSPGMVGSGARGYDWTHINSMSTLGPNRWYDAGDERFHPDNIIWDGRQTNIIAIIDKKTGKLVWQIGPEYNTSPELKKLGWIIGQHHAHMIPRGLPGEGNILVFDNGGQAGYGASNPGAPQGVGVARRDHSRILEFDPITLEVKWTNVPGFVGPGGPGPRPKSVSIYSGHISSAQRLPNGNTLITEGASGHLIELTPELDIVWDYVSPYFSKQFNANHVYRAYRLPYEWVPQVARPEETAIEMIDKSTFRVPGAPKSRIKKTTRIK